MSLGLDVKFLMLFCRITRKKLIVHVHDLLKDHPFLLNRFCKLVPPSEVGRPVLYHRNAYKTAIKLHDKPCAMSFGVEMLCFLPVRLARTLKAKACMDQCFSGDAMQSGVVVLSCAQVSSQAPEARFAICDWSAGCMSTGMTLPITRIA